MEFRNIKNRFEESIIEQQKDDKSILHWNAQVETI